MQACKTQYLSGDEASVYSLIVGDDEKTLFDIFLEENIRFI